MSTPSRLACLAALIAACGDGTAEPRDAAPSDGGLADAPGRDPDGGDPCAAAARFASTRAFVEGLGHGSAYTPLAADETAGVRAATAALLAGDRAGAETAAARVGYHVTPIVLGTECDLVLAPGAAAPAGQATLVVRPTFTRDLVLEAPHVPNDGHTDVEAALLFDALGAHAVAIAGASRCAVTTASGCHANTECNAAGIAVESDIAHSTRSAMHAMHLAVAARATVALQLHTNLEPTINGDALVSNGVRAPAAGSLAVRFWQALGTGADARTCNDATPPMAGAFCGTTNAQGLVSNGSADACQGSAGSASDRFIHLEQYSRRLDQVEAWSAQVGAALASALPAGGP
jgi:hypothetical protein